ncbi:MAG: SIS domain-containing protein [Actinomycetota bacterium]|nr:SIS domain-containing protein [Actinomycetota bacterium]
MTIGEEGVGLQGGTRNRTKLVHDAYLERGEVVSAFFHANADRLAHLCHAMARRFARDGVLIAFGPGAAASDAQHVSVEFVHPVIVGKRALPALALPNDIVSTLALAYGDRRDAFSHQLLTLGAPGDIALGMVHSPHDPGADSVAAALREAEAAGMLAIFLGGGSTGAASAEHRFEVASDDPFIVQEVHETLYHVLWELVHVFFEHKGLLVDQGGASSPGRAHDTGRSSFLYPFLKGAETDLAGVVSEISRSILQKADDVVALRAGSMDPEGLLETAGLIAGRIEGGGKVLVFGNGGSATDAQDLVGDLVAPPCDGSPIRAVSLTNDSAVLTAIGNDIGFDNVFARQVIAYGRPGDVAVAISTSGGSRNVLAALDEARRRGLLTVGFAGYGGGRLAEVCDRCHTVDADYIPRIQEAQATQYHVLRGLLNDLLG